jgi:hypothetical protein
MKMRYEVFISTPSIVTVGLAISSATWPIQIKVKQPQREISARWCHQRDQGSRRYRCWGQLQANGRFLGIQAGMRDRYKVNK